MTSRKTIGSAARTRDARPRQARAAGTSLQRAQGAGPSALIAGISALAEAASASAEPARARAQRRPPERTAPRSDQRRLAELKVKLGDEDYMNGAILRIATVLSARLTLR